MTEIKICTCKFHYQDRTYGSQLRVHNWCASHHPSKEGGWRCTVCGHEKGR